MWQVYVFSFFAGLLISNGAPHFIKGVMGQKNQTPFGKPSSAIVNVLWGWTNFVVGAVLLYFADVHSNEIAAFVLFAVAALLKALGSARNWSKHPENNE
jgi:hypothetical protein